MARGGEKIQHDRYGDQNRGGGHQYAKVGQQLFTEYKPRTEEIADTPAEQLTGSKQYQPDGRGGDETDRKDGIGAFLIAFSPPLGVENDTAYGDRQKDRGDQSQNRRANIDDRQGLCVEKIGDDDAVDKIAQRQCEGGDERRKKELPVFAGEQYSFDPCVGQPSGRLIGLIQLESLLSAYSSVSDRQQQYGCRPEARCVTGISDGIGVCP